MSYSARMQFKLSSYLVDHQPICSMFQNGHTGGY